MDLVTSVAGSFVDGNPLGLLVAGDTIPPKDTHFLMYKPLVEWDE